MNNDLILLNMVPDVGSLRTKALLEYFGSTQNIFKANINDLVKAAGIGSKISENILRVAKDRSLLDKELKLIEKYNAKVITLFDDGYPQILKQIHDPPIVLYVKGEFKIEDRLSVAIVGSRQCTRYGRDTAERLAKELADYGITVVSGLARGIDTAAHNGALSRNSRTIAFLGSGLANIYPPDNRKLADRIAECGAVVSEFPMGFKPLPENFPRRNRLISGMSQGVVVVEAAKDSGALITARFAAEQGREVFSVPGEACLNTTSGTNRLIRDGAKLVETAQDIIEELAPVIKAQLKFKDGLSQENKKPLPTDLKPEQLEVINFLSGESKDIDEIVQETKLSAATVSSALTALEIRALITRERGKFKCQNH